MDDLEQRLREIVTWNAPPHTIIVEAANELARLKAELALCRLRGEDRSYKELTDELSRVQALLGASQQNDARWKWMRVHWDEIDGNHDIWDSDGTPEGLDAAIDAAIGTQEKTT